jgi:hypothetical protein
MLRHLTNGRQLFCHTRPSRHVHRSFVQFTAYARDGRYSVQGPHSRLQQIRPLSSLCININLVFVLFTHTTPWNMANLWSQRVWRAIRCATCLATWVLAGRQYSLRVRRNPPRDIRVRSALSGGSNHIPLGKVWTRHTGTSHHPPDGNVRDY